MEHVNWAKSMSTDQLGTMTLRWTFDLRDCYHVTSWDCCRVWDTVPLVFWMTSSASVTHWVASATCLPRGKTNWWRTVGQRSAKACWSTLNDCLFLEFLSFMSFYSALLFKSVWVHFSCSICNKKNHDTWYRFYWQWIYEHPTTPNSSYKLSYFWHSHLSYWTVRNRQNI